MNRSNRSKSFLDDLLEDSPSSPTPKPRPSTAVVPSGTSRPKSVRFSETGRDQEFSSFGQTSRSLSSGSSPSASTFDQLFSNDGHGGGDDDDIIGSMSFTRGSRSNVSNVPTTGKKNDGNDVLHCGTWIG